MSKNRHSAPYILRTVHPDGSFSTTQAEEPEPLEEALFSTRRRYEVRPGEGYLRRDGSIAPDFEIWAVDDGQEWCVEVGLRSRRLATTRAAHWHRGWFDGASDAWW